MMDDLAKLAIENAADLFEGRKADLIRALDPVAPDLESVSSDVLLAALENRTFDGSEIEAVLALAAPHDPFDADAAAQALAELRAGNVREAERRLELALGPDMAFEALARSGAATLLFLSGLPVFMR